MQEAARCAEKLKRAPAFLAQRRGPQTFRGHPAAISLELRNQSEPPGQMVIPQAAGGFLEVGLEMKNGLPVLVMPATRELDELAHQLLAFPRDHLRNHLQAQAGKQPRVAGQVSAIEKRNGELRIVAVQRVALLQRARCRAGPQPEIPQQPRDLGHHLPMGHLQRMVGRQEENVHVGMRKQRATPIAAQGGKAEAPGCPGARGQAVSVESCHHGVSQRRALERGSLAVARGLKRLANPRGLRLIELPQGNFRGRNEHAHSLLQSAQTLELPMWEECREMLKVQGMWCGSVMQWRLRATYKAFSPRSSLRMRMASSTEDRKTFPSPILPVLAAFRMACTAASTRWSGKTISSLI